MSYLGNTPVTQSFISGTDYFNGTGSQTAFTLTRSVASINDIQVTVNNVVQQPNSGYTVSNTTLTFDQAPSAGTNNVYVRYLSTTTQAITPSQNTVSYSTLNSDNQSKLGISYKNRLINGNFGIWQRGTSASSAASYLADRWQLENAGTYSQSTDVPSGQGFPYSCTVSVTAGTAYGVIKQKIESVNCIDLVGQSVTLSFWVKNLTGSTSMTSVLFYANATDNFNGGVTSISSQNFTAVLNTWTKVTLTYTNLPAGVANGLQVYVFSADGSVAPSYRFTGAQLEVGTQATTFTTAGGSYGAELALCQRYYYLLASGINRTLGSGFYATSTRVDCNITFKTSMRAAPTFEQSSGTNFYAIYAGGISDLFNSFVGGSEIGTEGLSIYANSNVSGTTGQAGSVYTNNASSYIAFSAEL